MSVGITISSQVVANATVSRVHLRPTLGAYELVFGLDIAPTPPHGIAWWLTVQSMRVKIRGGTEREVGIARPDRLELIHQSLGAHPRTIFVYLDIHPHQVTALEDERNGRDLDFGFTLLGEGGNGAEVRDTFQSQLAAGVPRSRWIEELNSAGAMDILLLEIPLTAGPSTSAHAKAAKQLKQAQQHLAAGNYGDVVGACRVALEELGVNGHPLNLFHGTGRDTMTKAEREKAMLAAMRHYAHPPHHPGAEAYSRDDATLALRVTAAAIAAGSI